MALESESAENIDLSLENISNTDEDITSINYKSIILHRNNNNDDLFNHHNVQNNNEAILTILTKENLDKLKVENIEVTELKKKIFSYEDRIIQLESELKSTKEISDQQVMSITSKYQKDIDKLILESTRVSQLTNELHVLKKDRDEQIQNLTSSYESKIIILQSDYNQLKNELNEMNIQNSEVLVTLNNTINNLNNQITIVNVDNNKNIALINLYEKELRDLDNNITSTNKDKNLLYEELNIVTKERDELLMINKRKTFLSFLFNRNFNHNSNNILNHNNEIQNNNLISYITSIINENKVIRYSFIEGFVVVFLWKIIKIIYNNQIIKSFYNNILNVLSNIGTNDYIILFIISSLIFQLTFNVFNGFIYWILSLLKANVIKYFRIVVTLAIIACGIILNLFIYSVVTALLDEISTESIVAIIVYLSNLISKTYHLIRDQF